MTNLLACPPPLHTLNAATRWLQENFCGVGSGSTVMIVNVGPSPFDFDETVHALKYGAIAKDITIAPPKVDSRYVPVRLGSYVPIAALLPCQRRRLP